MALKLLEMGHPQPVIPIHYDNTTAVGIVNNTMERQRSRAMEMRCFWLLDSGVQRRFAVYYHPGQENWVTTRRSITWELTIQRPDLSTYTCPILHNFTSCSAT